MVYNPIITDDQYVIYDMSIYIYIYVYMMMIWLVVSLPLWKMMELVSWDDDIPNIWNNKKSSKPPTSYF